jgi:crotonobetainyl-CoA:carnitine CoA-transferase CaiB-like acyl-CoA transferase
MYAFAPSSTAVLADWGADVIKIVQPSVGDPMMGTPIAGLPEKDVGVAFMWELLNRGKRSAGIDISVDAGYELLLELVRGADVFVTNLLPRPRARLRIEPTDLFAVNPRLVYGRASAHGPEGPEGEEGGYDHTDFWARTGIGHAASMVSDEFVPQPGPALGDLAAGGFLAGAIAAALYRRSRTDQGAVVDVSLLSAGVWMGGPGLMASRLYEVDAIPRRRHADLPNPLVAAYTTRDSRQIYVAGIMTERHFENFCETIGRLDLLKDPRFETGAARVANARECIAVLDALFAERDLDDWAGALRGLNTPWTVVQSAAEAAVDPQVLANHFLVDVEGTERHFPIAASPAQFDGQPPSLRQAPSHGEHTDDILLELGHGWDEIIALKEAGAVL